MFTSDSADKTLDDRYGSNLAARRMAAYGALLLVLLACAAALHQVRWHGSRELHTLMEAIAALLALIAGVKA